MDSSCDENNYNINEERVADFDNDGSDGVEEVSNKKAKTKQLSGQKRPRPPRIPGACQCPKPGDLPEVDGEGEPSASVSWANGVSLGSQVSSERRDTVDAVLLGQFTIAIRQLRPSMTESEYDKAKQAWNKEMMSGNLLNVNDFITEKNLRAKRRMTKVTMKRNFIR